MNEETPYAWVKQIDTALLALEQRPQFQGPAFPWKQCEEQLQKFLSSTTLQLDHQLKGWQENESFAEVFEGNNFIYTIHFSSLNEPLYWCMRQHDIRSLMVILLKGEDEAAFFFDQALVEGFYTYFLTEVLKAVDGIQFAPKLSLRLGSYILQPPEESSKYFECVVNAKVQDQQVGGRLFISESFRSSWNRYLVQHSKPSFTEKSLENFFVDVSLEVGSVQLSQQQWKQAGLGDFILLDHCTFDPAIKKGRILLTVGEKPLFRGKMTQEGLKILEYPLYENEEIFMEKDEAYEDESLEDEEDLYDDEVDESSSEYLDKDILDSNLDSEEEIQEELEEDSSPTAKPAKQVNSKPVSIEEVPLRITVEVARLQMTAKELKELSPGSLLDLKIRPEQGVDLVVNGKKIGHGELLKMGEMLGVRIVEL